MVGINKRALILDYLQDSLDNDTVKLNNCHQCYVNQIFYKITNIWVLFRNILYKYLKFSILMVMY